METKTNIFFHAPKELTTDAFLVWLIYYLDSDEENKEYKQAFFDSLILKKEDCCRTVGSIELKRQENNVDVLLTFRFEDNGEEQTVLFEDKTWSMPHSGQLARYKEIYPNCYRYIYYKTGYVTTIEEQAVSQNHYDLVTDGMMESVLESISELHPLIKIYTDYLNSEAEAFNYYHERLFLNHDKEILHDSAAQKYLLDTLLENIAEDNWIIKIE